MRHACEDCKHYYFYDSAYGRCLRFPPQEYFYTTGLLFKKQRSKVRYPFIPFDNEICAEFIEKEFKK